MAKINESTYKIKQTPINIIHTQIRTANVLGLEKIQKELFTQYKKMGGKRNLKTLLKTKPIYEKPVKNPSTNKHNK